MTFSEFYESKVDVQTTYYDHEDDVVRYGETEFNLVVDAMVWNDMESALTKEQEEVIGEWCALRDIEGFDLSNMEGIERTIQWLGQYGPVNVNLVQSYNNAVQRIEDFFKSMVGEIDDPYNCDDEVDEDKWYEEFSDYLD